MDPLIAAQLDGDVKLQEWVNLNLLPAFVDKGGADTGGPNALPHGVSVWTSGPTASLTFKPKVRFKGQPWDNVYRAATLSTGHLPCVYFGFGLSFMYPTQKDIDVSTAVEFELALAEAGLEYDMGWQFKPSKVDGPPAVRWFDELNQHWVTPTGISPFVPKPGVWTDVQAYFSIDRLNQVTTHVALAINGHPYQINAAHKAKFKYATKPWYLHAAAQLDSDGKGSPYGIQIKNWSARGL